MMPHHVSVPRANTPDLDVSPAPLAYRWHRLPSIWGIVALLLSPSAAPAQPSNRASTETMAHRATERLGALEREAELLASQERTVLGELRQLEIERQLRTQQVLGINAELDQLARELEDSSARIQTLEQKQASERAVVERRLVELYKLGGSGYLRMLLSSPDLRTLARTYRLASALARLDRQRIVEHHQTLQAVRTAHQQLEERHHQLAQLQHDARSARVAADRAAEARVRLVAEIDARRDLTAQLAGELQRAQQKLQQVLGTLARSSTVELATLPLRPFRGELDWPVQGQLVTRFGSTSGSQSGQNRRNGIEISATDGSEARAVHHGRVTFAGPFTGFGNLVVLDHGGKAYTVYGHLESLAVQRGGAVAGGEPVGDVGLSPTGGRALYFELRIDGEPVDPIQWLKRRPRTGR